MKPKQHEPIPISHSPEPILEDDTDEFFSDPFGFLAAFFPACLFAGFELDSVSLALLSSGLKMLLLAAAFGSAAARRTGLLGAPRAGAAERAAVVERPDWGPVVEDTLRLVVFCWASDLRWAGENNVRTLQSTVPDSQPPEES